MEIASNCHLTTYIPIKQCGSQLSSENFSVQGMVVNVDAHNCSESREEVSVEGSTTGGTVSHTHPSATIKEDGWKDHRSQRSGKTRMRQ